MSLLQHRVWYSLFTQFRVDSIRWFSRTSYSMSCVSCIIVSIGYGYVHEYWQLFYLIMKISGEDIFYSTSLCATQWFLTNNINIPKLCNSPLIPSASHKIYHPPGTLPLVLLPMTVSRAMRFANYVPNSSGLIGNTSRKQLSWRTIEEPSGATGDPYRTDWCLPSQRRRP